MRASFFVALLLSVAPTASFACSCSGTLSIGNALTLADAVVVGTVRGHREAHYSSADQRPALINVEVTRSLKGGVNGSIEIAKALMCYQSFPEDDFEVGKSYVFPLERVDLANPGQARDLMIWSDSAPAPSHKMFRLPVCSHNALLLEGQGLYTSELTSAGGRRLEYYMPLLFVRMLLPLGLLSTWGILIVIAVAAAAAFFVVRNRRRNRPHAV
jgi:hypothetical protein